MQDSALVSHLCGLLLGSTINDFPKTCLIVSLSETDLSMHGCGGPSLLLPGASRACLVLSQCLQLVLEAQQTIIFVTAHSTWLCMHMPCSRAQ